MRYFSYDSDPKLTCSCGCGGKMDEGTLKRLDDLRHHCGFSFTITSGYRCPEYNNRVSRSGLHGAHTTGQAVDIARSGAQAELIMALAPLFGFRGIGANQKGAHKNRFVHIDDVGTEISAYELMPDAVNAIVEHLKRRGTAATKGITRPMAWSY